MCFMCPIRRERMDMAVGQRVQMVVLEPASETLNALIPPGVGKPRAAAARTDWSGSRPRRDKPLGFMPREGVNNGDNHEGDPGAI
jgi:hypothetical protein